MLTPPLGLPSIDEVETSLTVPAQRATGVEDVSTAPPVAPPPPVSAPAGVCLCGHAEEAHEHYRAGDDCGACGADVCAGYRPAEGRGAKKGLLRRLGLRR